MKPPCDTFSDTVLRFKCKEPLLKMPPPPCAEWIFRLIVRNSGFNDPEFAGVVDSTAIPICMIRADDGLIDDQVAFPIMDSPT